MIIRIENFYRKKMWSPERYAKFQGVKIGKNCNIQDVSFGTEPYLIEIGNHVQITSGTKIFTHGGGWVLRDIYPDLDYFGKVIIRDNVYIGNNSLIMPGVIINKNVIVGAGSVVTKSIPEGKIVAGNPARIVADIDEYSEKIRPYDLGTKKMSAAEKRKYLLSAGDEKFIKK